MSSLASSNGSHTNGWTASLNLPHVCLAEVRPAAAATDLVPGQYALQHQVLPLHLEGDTMVVAIGSGDALAAVDDLGVLIARPVRAVLADPQLIRDRIEERFLEEILSQLPSEEGAVADFEDVTDLADLQKMAGETAVVQMVNLIFAQAVRDVQQGLGAERREEASRHAAAREREHDRRRPRPSHPDPPAIRHARRIGAPREAEAGRLPVRDLAR